MRKPLLAVLLASLLGNLSASAQTNSETDLSLSMLIEGKDVPGSGNFQIPVNSRNIRIWVRGTQDGKPADVGRLRFKLDGFDKDWWELGADMGLRAHFSNDSKTEFPQITFPVVGLSQGWNRDIAHSKLTHRKESIQVPAGAQYLRIAISSAGPPTAVGVYAVSNLSLQKQAVDGSLVKLSLEMFPEKGETLAKDAKLNGWSREGTAPAMAKILVVGSAQPTYALGIVDANTGCHADWLSAPVGIEGIEAGSRLLLEWDEVFSVGYGQVSRADYTTIPPGNYIFRVNKLDTNGNPLAYEKSIPVAVALPVWKGPWLWIIIFNGMALLLIFWVRRASRKKARKEIEELRQEYLLESERLRIARNIHDDLGARLTRVIMASGMAADHSDNLSEAKTGLHEISNMTKDLVAALHETVWAVDPKNDSLQSLIDFICDGTQKLCGSANIRCELEVCEIVRNIQLSSEFRHHVCLAVKEAVHNAIKHSGTGILTLSISCADKSLSIEVGDRGTGLLENRHEGHGLENMRFRTEAVGGRFSVRGGKISGTTVRFEIPIAG